MVRNNHRSSIGTKITAIFLLFFFTLSENFSYALNTGIPRNPSLVSPSLGTIEEIFPGKSGKTIFFIQDAHASFEAQLHISGMIQELVQKQGVQTVFEEGFEGPVPSDSYFGWIKDSKTRDRAAYHFLDQLLIGGAEYAHITRHGAKRMAQSENNIPGGNTSERLALSAMRSGDFRLIGIENQRLYFKNLEEAKTSSQNQKEIERDLKVLQATLLKLIQKKTPRMVQDWLSLRSKAKEHTELYGEYLRRTVGWIKATSPTKRKTPSADFFQALFQTQRPRDLPQLKISDLQALIAQLEEEFLNAWLQPKQRRLIETWKTLEGFEKLSELKLSSNEYLQIREYLHALKTPDLAKYLARESGRSLIFSRSWENAIRSSSDFYETAVKRSEAAYQNLEHEISQSRESKFILVFGGFHKEDFLREFQKAGHSCVLIQPNISAPDFKHETRYQELIESPDLEKSASVSRAMRAANLLLRKGGREQVARYVGLPLPSFQKMKSGRNELRTTQDFSDEAFNAILEEGGRLAAASFDAANMARLKTLKRQFYEFFIHDIQSGEAERILSKIIPDKELPKDESPAALARALYISETSVRERLTYYKKEQTAWDPPIVTINLVASTARVPTADEQQILHHVWDFLNILTGVKVAMEGIKEEQISGKEQVVTGAFSDLSNYRDYPARLMEFFRAVDGNVVRKSFGLTIPYLRQLDFGTMQGPLNFYANLFVGLSPSLRSDVEILEALPWVTEICLILAQPFKSADGKTTQLLNPPMLELAFDEAHPLMDLPVWHRMIQNHELRKPFPRKSIKLVFLTGEFDFEKGREAIPDLEMNASELQKFVFKSSDDPAEKHEKIRALMARAIERKTFAISRAQFYSSAGRQAFETQLGRTDAHRQALRERLAFQIRYSEVAGAPILSRQPAQRERQEKILREWDRRKLELDAAKTYRATLGVDEKDVEDKKRADLATQYYFLDAENHFAPLAQLIRAKTEQGVWQIPSRAWNKNSSQFYSAMKTWTAAARAIDEVTSKLDPKRRQVCFALACASLVRIWGVLEARFYEKNNNEAAVKLASRAIANHFRLEDAERAVAEKILLGNGSAPAAAAPKAPTELSFDTIEKSEAIWALALSPEDDQYSRLEQAIENASTQVTQYQDQQRAKEPPAFGFSSEATLQNWLAAWKAWQSQTQGEEIQNLETRVEKLRKKWEALKNFRLWFESDREELEANLAEIPDLSDLGEEADRARTFVTQTIETAKRNAIQIAIHQAKDILRQAQGNADARIAKAREAVKMVKAAIGDRSAVSAGALLLADQCLIDLQAAEWSASILGDFQWVRVVKAYQKNPNEISLPPILEKISKAERLTPKEYKTLEEASVQARRSIDPSAHFKGAVDRNIAQAVIALADLLRTAARAELRRDLTVLKNKTTNPKLFWTQSVRALLLASFVGIGFFLKASGESLPANQEVTQKIDPSELAKPRDPPISENTNRVYALQNYAAKVGLPVEILKQINATNIEASVVEFDLKETQSLPQSPTFVSLGDNQLALLDFSKTAALLSKAEKDRPLADYLLQKANLPQVKLPVIFIFRSATRTPDLRFVYAHEVSHLPDPENEFNASGAINTHQYLKNPHEIKSYLTEILSFRLMNPANSVRDFVRVREGWPPQSMSDKELDLILSNPSNALPNLYQVLWRLVDVVEFRGLKLKTTNLREVRESVMQMAAPMFAPLPVAPGKTSQTNRPRSELRQTLQSIPTSIPILSRFNPTDRMTKLSEAIAYRKRTLEKGGMGLDKDQVDLAQLLLSEFDIRDSRKPKEFLEFEDLNLFFTEEAGRPLRVLLWNLTDGPTGSFKDYTPILLYHKVWSAIRQRAHNLIPDEVIVVSTGNHAIANAQAVQKVKDYFQRRTGTELKIRLVVYMGEDAAPHKVEMVKGLGATVIQTRPDGQKIKSYREAEEFVEEKIAEEVQRLRQTQEKNPKIIQTRHADPFVTAGYSVPGREMARALKKLFPKAHWPGDNVALSSPMGSGGLPTGLSELQAEMPEIKTFVSSAGPANLSYRSLLARIRGDRHAVIREDVPANIWTDGNAATPEPYALRWLEQSVEDALLVPDESTVPILSLLRDHGINAEATTALPLVSFLLHRKKFNGIRTIILPITSAHQSEQLQEELTQKWPKSDHLISDLHQYYAGLRSELRSVMIDDLTSTTPATDLSIPDLSAAVPLTYDLPLWLVSKKVTFDDTQKEAPKIANFLQERMGWNQHLSAPEKISDHIKPVTFRFYVRMIFSSLLQTRKWIQALMITAVVTFLSAVIWFVLTHHWVLAAGLLCCPPFLLPALSVKENYGFWFHKQHKDRNVVLKSIVAIMLHWVYQSSFLYDSVKYLSGWSADTENKEIYVRTGKSGEMTFYATIHELTHLLRPQDKQLGNAAELMALAEVSLREGAEAKWRAKQATGKLEGMAALTLYISPKTAMMGHNAGFSIWQWIKGEYMEAFWKAYDLLKPKENWERDPAPITVAEWGHAKNWAGDDKYLLVPTSWLEANQGWFQSEESYTWGTHLAGIALALYLRARERGADQDKALRVAWDYINHQEFDGEVSDWETISRANLEKRLAKFSLFPTNTTSVANRTETRAPSLETIELNGKDVLRELLLAAVKMAQHICDHPPQMILFSGASGLLTRAVMAAAWQSHFAHRQTPPVGVISPETNFDLFHKALQESGLHSGLLIGDRRAQALHAIEAHAQRNAGTLRNQVLSETEMRWEDPRILLIDDHANSGFKYEALRRVFPLLGFNQVSFGFLVASAFLEPPLSNDLLVATMTNLPLVLAIAQLAGMTRHVELEEIDEHLGLLIEQFIEKLRHLVLPEDLRLDSVKKLAEARRTEMRSVTMTAPAHQLLVKPAGATFGHEEGAIFDFRSGGDIQPATATSILEESEMLQPQSVKPNESVAISLGDLPYKTLFADLDPCTFLVIYVPETGRIYFAHSHVENFEPMENLWKQFQQEARGKQAYAFLAGGTNYQKVRPEIISRIEASRREMISKIRAAEIPLALAIPEQKDLEVNAFFDPVNLRAAVYVVPRSELRLDLTKKIFEAGFDLRSPDIEKILAEYVQTKDAERRQLLRAYAVMSYQIVPARERFLWIRSLVTFRMQPGRRDDAKQITDAAIEMLKKDPAQEAKFRLDYLLNLLAPLFQRERQKPTNSVTLENAQAAEKMIQDLIKDEDWAEVILKMLPRLFQESGGPAMAEKVYRIIYSERPKLAERGTKYLVKSMKNAAAQNAIEKMLAVFLSEPTWSDWVRKGGKTAAKEQPLVKDAWSRVRQSAANRAELRDFYRKFYEATDDHVFKQGISGFRARVGLDDWSQEALAAFRLYAYLYAKDQVQQLGKKELTFLLAHDPRPSWKAVREAVIQGLRLAEQEFKVTLHIEDLGLITTPMASLAVGFFKADGAINITASHNEPFDNGLKLLTSFQKSLRSVGPGAMIGEVQLQRITEAFKAIRESRKQFRDFETRCSKLDTVPAEEVDFEKIRKLRVAYINFLKEQFPFLDKSLLHKLRVLVDTNGGAGAGNLGADDPGHVVWVLRELGLDVFDINPEIGKQKHAIEPKEKGPALQQIQEELEKLKRTLGVVFDWDADRGTLDQMTPQEMAAFNVAMTLSAIRAYPEKYQLKPDQEIVVITHSTSSVRVEEIVKRFKKSGMNIRVRRVAVGEAHVIKAMKEERENGAFVPIGMEAASGGSIYRMALCRDGTATLLLAASALVDPKIYQAWYRVLGRQWTAKRRPSFRELALSIPSSMEHLDRITSHVKDKAVLRREMKRVFENAWQLSRARKIGPFAEFAAYDLKFIRGTKVSNSITHQSTEAWNLFLRHRDGTLAYLEFRASNTEPILRYLVDAEHKKDFDALQEWFTSNLKSAVQSISERSEKRVLKNDFSVKLTEYLTEFLMKKRRFPTWQEIRNTFAHLPEGMPEIPTEDKRVVFVCIACSSGLVGFANEIFRNSGTQTIAKLFYALEIRPCFGECASGPGIAIGEKMHARLSENEMFQKIATSISKRLERILPRSEMRTYPHSVPGEEDPILEANPIRAEVRSYGEYSRNPGTRDGRAILVQRLKTLFDSETDPEESQYRDFIDLMNTSKLMTQAVSFVFQAFPHIQHQSEKLLRWKKILDLIRNSELVSEGDAPREGIKEVARRLAYWFGEEKENHQNLAWDIRETLVDEPGWEELDSKLIRYLVAHIKEVQRKTIVNDPSPAEVMKAAANQFEALLTLAGIAADGHLKVAESVEMNLRHSSERFKDQEAGLAFIRLWLKRSPGDRALLIQTFELANAQPETGMDTNGAARVLTLLNSYRAENAVEGVRAELRLELSPKNTEALRIFNGLFEDQPINGMHIFFTEIFLYSDKHQLNLNPENFLHLLYHNQGFQSYVMNALLQRNRSQRELPEQIWDVIRTGIILESLLREPALSGLRGEKLKLKTVLTAFEQLTELGFSDFEIFEILRGSKSKEGLPGLPSFLSSIMTDGTSRSGVVAIEAIIRAAKRQKTLVPRSEVRTRGSIKSVEAVSKNRQLRWLLDDFLEQGSVNSLRHFMAEVRASNKYEQGATLLLEAFPDLQHEAGLTETRWQQALLFYQADKKGAAELAHRIAAWLAENHGAKANHHLHAWYAREMLVKAGWKELDAILVREIVHDILGRRQKAREAKGAGNTGLEEAVLNRAKLHRHYLNLIIKLSSHLLIAPLIEALNERSPELIGELLKELVYHSGINLDAMDREIKPRLANMRQADWTEAMRVARSEMRQSLMTSKNQKSTKLVQVDFRDFVEHFSYKQRAEVVAEVALQKEVSLVIHHADPTNDHYSDLRDLFNQPIFGGRAKLSAQGAPVQVSQTKRINLVLFKNPEYRPQGDHQTLIFGYQNDRGGLIHEDGTLGVALSAASGLNASELERNLPEGVGLNRSNQTLYAKSPSAASFARLREMQMSVAFSWFA